MFSEIVSTTDCKEESYNLFKSILTCLITKPNVCIFFQCTYKNVSWTTLKDYLNDAL